MSVVKTKPKEELTPGMMYWDSKIMLVKIEDDPFYSDCCILTYMYPNGKLILHSYKKSQFTVKTECLSR